MGMSEIDSPKRERFFTVSGKESLAVRYVGLDVGNFQAGVFPFLHSDA